MNKRGHTVMFVTIRDRGLESPVRLVNHPTDVFMNRSTFVASSFRIVQPTFNQGWATIVLEQIPEHIDEQLRSVFGEKKRRALVTYMKANVVTGRVAWAQPDRATYIELGEKRPAGGHE